MFVLFAFWKLAAVFFLSNFIHMRIFVSFPLHTQTLTKYKELVNFSFMDNLQIYLHWAICPHSSYSVSQPEVWQQRIPGSCSAPWANRRTGNIFYLENSQMLSLGFQNKPLLDCQALTEYWVGVFVLMQRNSIPE